MENQMQEYVERTVNKDAEMGLLGALLLQQQWYYQVRDQISRKSFYYTRHRRIWDAMEALLEDETQLGPLTVGDKLADNGHLEAVGGASYITRLSGYTPSAAQAPAYARILKRHENLRRLHRVGQRIQQKVLEPEADPEAISADVLDVIRTDTASATTRMTSEQIDEQFGSTLEGGDEDKKCWSTSIHGLDWLLGGGLVGGRNIFLAALPKMGKSSAAIAIAANVAERHDFAVDLYGVEQSHEELEARFVSSIENCSVSEAMEVIREGGSYEDVDPELREKIERGRAKFRSWDLEIDVRGEHHAADIALAAQARVANLPDDRAGRYLLVVDYLQAMTAGNRSGDRWGDLVDVSTKIRDVAKSLNVPVLSLLQFGSSAEKKFIEQDERPRFPDLWGSTQFQKDANHLITLHRPYYDQGGEAEHFCQLHQELSRHGRNGCHADLYADLERCRFGGWNQPPPSPDTEKSEDKGWSNDHWAT